MREVPEIRILDMVTVAGDGAANVDRVGSGGNVAWVIDGATDLYDEPYLPAASDVEWLVDTVSDRLADAGRSGYRGAADALLDEIADDICRRQEAYAFPADRLPPACSVAVIVDQGPSYSVSRIGDATAVVTGDREAILSTEFFDARERVAVGRKQAGHDTAEQVRAGMLSRRLQTMTSADLESVFSGHPRRRLRPHTIRGDWHGVGQILLCTDGFARVVTDYAVHGQWRDVVNDARTHGLDHLARLIRALEHGTANPSGGRFKRSDDLAALLLAPEAATS